MALDQPQKYNQTWQQMLDKFTIPELQGMIKDIDSRSKSLRFAIKEIALGTADLKQAEYLFIEPNNKLSRGDLQRKKDYIQAKIDQLRQEAVAKEAKELQLQQDIVKELRTEEAAKFDSFRKQAIQDYLKNPTWFFADVLNIPNGVEEHKVKIFSSADQIIAACPYFAADTDPLQLWKAWKIVAEARDLSAKDFTQYVEQQKNLKLSGEELFKSKVLADELFKVNERFVTGAKKLFKILLDKLPRDYVELQFLYDANLFAKVQTYLQTIYSGVEKNPDLLNAISVDFVDASKRLARRSLNTKDGFQGLDEKNKDSLIEKQAYLLRLDFDLRNLPLDRSKPIESKIAVELDLLKTLISRMRTNIDNTLNSKKIPADEFSRIKGDANERLEALRRATGITVKQDEVAKKANSVKRKTHDNSTSNKKSKKPRRP